MRFDTTQYYRPEYDTTKAHLNRTHLSQVFSRSLSEHSSINIGLELDAQSLKQKLPDDAKINRLWSKIYGDFNLHSSNIRLGVTLSEKEAHPVIKISNFLKMNNVGSIKSGIYYYAKPSHLYRLDSKGMEKWLNVNVIGEFNFNKLPLSIRLDFVNTDSEMSYRYAEDLDAIDLSNNLITSTIGTMLPIIRDWKIEINYRHTFNTNIYADGIGDKIKIGLNIAERLFKNNMSLNFNLWTEGCLNHNNKIGYDAFHFGPFATDNINYDLPDYWVFNLDLAVRVSKLTFGWRVNNILNTFEGLTEQILPDLGEEYLLITNNLNFPPMSRFVSFNIIWEFDN